MPHRRSRHRARNTAAWAVGTLLLATGLQACSDNGDALPDDLGKRPSSSQAQGQPRAPQGAANVVLITADDMSIDDVAHMPHLQRLVGERGVTIEDGLAPTPICVPARASLLTGQYAHNHTALTINGRNGGFKSFEDEDTLPVWLQEAGYDTLFVGKYLNGYGENDQTYLPPGWSDFRASIDYSTYSFTDTLFNANGRVVKPAGYSTDLIAEMTTEMLADRPDPDRPFYLWANYVAPHTGGGDESDDPKVTQSDPEAQLATTRPADRHRNTFSDEELPDVPEMWRAPDKSRWATKKKSGAYRSAMREVNQQRIESLQAVDEAIRDTVKALRKQGELDDTYVIVTSDNGFMTGHNNKMGKLLPYDNSLRIPILVRGPGLPEGTSTELAVTNPDLAATIAALAGAEPGRVVDGVDVLPWLTEGRNGQRIIPIEAWPLNGGRKNKRVYSGIRFGPYTYVLPRGGAPELYDRSRDPGELKNVAGEPAYAQVLAQLAEWDDRYRDCAGQECPTELEETELVPAKG
ncbi:sulfatase-like hydrolase/transferase [Nocardioides alcanivorans]|uniref:sulfatase-like hydrolase/transferase n=1 Tax=Nocardioides alcanivorans TaxID=2897352 RepID=UPI001F26A3A1|nr:sulfatase-like hydrolase/transferase [Nocardioides alcanivorans]